MLIIWYAGLWFRVCMTESSQIELSALFFMCNPPLFLDHLAQLLTKYFSHLLLPCELLLAQTIIIGSSFQLEICVPQPPLWFVTFDEPDQFSGVLKSVTFWSLHWMVTPKFTITLRWGNLHSPVHGCKECPHFVDGMDKNPTLFTCRSALGEQSADWRIFSCNCKLHLVLFPQGLTLCPILCSSNLCSPLDLIYKNCMVFYH